MNTSMIEIMEAFIFIQISLAAGYFTHVTQCRSERSEESLVSG
jgi:hypothetical protein